LFEVKGAFLRGTARLKGQIISVPPRLESLSHGLLAGSISSGVEVFWFGMLWVVFVFVLHSVFTSVHVVWTWTSKWPHEKLWAWHDTPRHHIRTNISQNMHRHCTGDFNNAVQLFPEEQESAIFLT